MRLAIGQAPTSLHIEDNARVAAQLVRVAALKGADVLVLSELFLSGYDPVAVASDRARQITTTEDHRLDVLRDACRQNQLTVFLGSPLRDESGALRNAVVSIDSSGTTNLVYSKVHLWDDEHRVFKAGDELSLVEVADARIGFGICYDAGFPELVRAYARAGADVVVFCSAFATGDEEHRYAIYHPARALENGIFVAVANCVGTENGRDFFGRSQMFGPDGTCVAEARRDNDVIVCQIDREPNTTRAERSYLDDLRLPLPVATKGRL